MPMVTRGECAIPRQTKPVFVRIVSREADQVRIILGE